MFDFDVVISGAGPVGMTLALDLGKRGIRTLIVERNETTTRHPKMDITNARSMEIFRHLGIAEELRAVAVPESHPFDVSWITGFTGHELYRFAYPSAEEMRVRIRECNDGSQMREPAMRVSQTEIEPVLRTALEREPLVDLRFSTAYESFSEREDHVEVTVADTTTGDAHRYTCRYLVGCDGGGSRVRRHLGIGLQGQANIMERFMTHFRSPERQLLQRWGIAWHYQSPYGTLIAQNDRDIWTLHSRFGAEGPGKSDPKALVRKFVGRDIDCEILVANEWSPHLLVADSYGGGRVFLAGDAAHQYIPTGGYGMNTGIGDASNLGWKLAAVIGGIASPALLNSYGQERRPVGLRNCDAAGQNNQVRQDISALYTSDIFEDTEAGAAQRRRATARIAEIGNLENEAWGIEHGFTYAGSPAIWPEKSPAPDWDPARYVPTTRPGARLPSLFLPDGTAIYDMLGPWFTLLVFGGADPGDFASVAKRLGVPLKIVAADGADVLECYESPLVLVRPDLHVAWRATGEVASPEAVLLRALGHGDPDTAASPG
jgi:2-polyprenyl-6-methoxyphenol hydroxylase-like FAD-dependent oxidoreductase